MLQTAYGKTIKSDQLIPGLLTALPDSGIDIRIYLQQVPNCQYSYHIETDKPYYTGRHLDEDGDPTLLIWGSPCGRSHLVCYRDGTRFYISNAGQEIWTTWLDEMTFADTTTYLLGPIFGFILRLRGITCLHASVIAINNQAVAIIGVAGAGKSTTAASFATMGYPVLTEDVAALDDEGDKFYIRPGYPVIRLWPSSVEMLFGAPDALPLMTPNWDKRYLDLTREGFKFQKESLPLGAIYFLQERSDNPDAPIIEPVSPQTGLIDLVANAYTNYLLDKDMRAREFDLLGRIVQRIPLRKLTPHSDPQRLPDLCRAIISDFENL